ncbi:digestive cysteine proteinase 1-like isoform X3 [Excalfactoria chinensis]|uniref:digestive cysteine proteinase 1-like isoform X3 n=1 Tax=Excalfactoria chinensis TaxID=46218 RepID=UPI003B3A1A46
MEGWRWLLVLGAAVLLGAESKAPPERPTFGDVYHVKGAISLPYAEIREPFEAWYNLSGGKSRIEYYGGQVVTFQFGSMGPFGASFKVTPETTETEVNVRKCFRINGTDGDLITPQSVFPNLEHFREFVGTTLHTEHVHHRLFHHYKERFGKRYSSEEEHEHRKHTFIHNMRFVHSKNRAALSYSLALNHLADRTPQEMAAMRGRRRSGDPNHGLPFSMQLYAGLVLPESLDWRLYGAVTPVKDQAVCGSCWSFATTGAMEGALFLKTGVLTPLSQQVLIDCSWGFGNYACDGGEEWRAYEWIKKHGGIASTESYGPYLGQNGYCHYNQSELVAPLAGYVTVEPGNAEALKAALFKHGPIAVNIDASHKSFTFYANGVYEEPHCGNETSELDHAVLAVGYGVLHGKSYWLIKNSWSTYWGNDGYILMAMKDNNCGVATAASFPILA